MFKKLICIICAVSVLMSVSLMNTMSVSAKTAVNKYPAPSSLVAVSYSEKTVRIQWKLSKKLKKKAGFQVLVYNEKTKKYVNSGDTRKKYYNLKNLPETKERKIKVRTYVKKGKKLYYGKSTLVKIPMPVKGVEVKSVKYRSKGKVTVKWNKSSEAGGYILQYSPNAKFPKAQICTLVYTDKEQTSVDITGLGKSDYYFRITPFKNISGGRYSGNWSAVKSVNVKEGCSFKEMLNSYSTDLSGKSEILTLTKNGVDISKYNYTYSRFKAIYNWHKANAQSFASCYYCTINFNKCVDALFGKTKMYDDFIWMADGNFQNRSGSRPIHKWSVIYLSGVPFVVDPRIDSYIEESCFGLPKGNKTEKRFLFKQWYASNRKLTVFTSGFATEYKIL